jgi:hypothetical protein
MSLEFVAEIIGCSTHIVMLLEDAFDIGIIPQQYVDDRELPDRRGKNP